MSAGVADFVIEQGADWAVQIYWVAEQTNDAIQAASPMEMDIVSPVTGQRLIRLDDGGQNGTGNGGIDSGGAPFGIVQLQIAADVSMTFAPGNYVYDLWVMAVGPPQQRLRLLRGGVTVAAAVTDLGVALGQHANAGVKPPDIMLKTADDGTSTIFTFDNTMPINQYKSAERNVPQRAALIGAGSYPNAHPALYRNTAGQTGPLRNVYNVPLTASAVNNWLSLGAVITVTYDAQTHGMVVSKVETQPGSAPSPAILQLESANGGGNA